jgi:hypothetical protein
MAKLRTSVLHSQQVRIFKTTPALQKGSEKGDLANASPRIVDDVSCTVAWLLPYMHIERRV